MAYEIRVVTTTIRCLKLVNKMAAFRVNKEIYTWYIHSVKVGNGINWLGNRRGVRDCDVTCLAFVSRGQDIWCHASVTLPHDVTRLRHAAR